MKNGEIFSGLKHKGQLLVQDLKYREREKERKILFFEMSNDIASQPTREAFKMKNLFAVFVASSPAVH